MSEVMGTKWENIYVILKDLGGMLYQEWNIRVRSMRMF